MFYKQEQEFMLEWSYRIEEWHVQSGSLEGVPPWWVLTGLRRNSGVLLLSEDIQILEDIANVWSPWLGQKPSPLDKTNSSELAGW